MVVEAFYDDFKTAALCTHNDLEQLDDNSFIRIVQQIFSVGKGEAKDLILNG